MNRKATECQETGRELREPMNLPQTCSSHRHAEITGERNAEEREGGEARSCQAWGPEPRPGERRVRSIMCYLWTCF